HPAHAGDVQEEGRRQVGARRMTLVKNILAAALAFLLAAQAASALPLSEAEMQALAGTVESFDAAMRNEDFGALAATIPPRVLTHIAETADLDTETLRGVIVQQMEQALAAVKLESFSMDLAK